MSNHRGGGKSKGISWNKQKTEPKFIREFKERIAYKEQASIETKKVKLDNDLNIEGEEERPQVVQLRSGDLDEKAYLELKSKEEIENSASSFGKILYKKPNKKINTSNSNSNLPEKKSSEIDMIFNLDKDGIEISATEVESNNKESFKEKILLNEENQEDTKYGLQEPPFKKRYIDGPTSKVTSKTAAKVLAHEAKYDKKLLSFYNEEEEQNDQSSNDEG